MSSLFFSITKSNINNIMNNPLLTKSTLPYGVPQFDKIETQHYIPAFKQAIEEGKAEMLMETLYTYYMRNVDDLPVEFLNFISEGHPKERVVCDYVGAMSDRFAIAKYEEIYIPKTWHI